MHVIDRLRSLSLPLATGVLAATLLAPAAAQACGGFFCQITPVEQNAERILFQIDPDGTITTTVEISYVGAPEGFSWVVPVYDTPDLLTVPPSALRMLDGATTPTIIAPPTKCTGPGGGGFMTRSGGVAFADSAAEDGGGSVTVEDLPQVGPFDPEVVSSDDPDALIEWLNTNDYLITEPMEPFVAEYVTSGMKFLAMKLAPGAGTADITPISMKMAGGAPMIPISLTAVAAEPEMGVMAFIVGEGRYESNNFGNLTVDVEDVQADPRNGANNYYPLLSWLIDEAGGRAFVTEYADTNLATRQNVDNFFGFFTDDDAEARQWLQETLEEGAFVTRLYTRLSGWEMAFDPTFARAETDALVDRVLDLSDRPAVEVCAGGPNANEPEPCGQTYCGQDAMCATTDAGIDGCVCPAGSTARTIREPDTPGGFLRETVVCQQTELEFMADVLGTAGGPADPCDGVTCGDFGQCQAVNGFATCACDEGFAAVPDGAGGAVCSQVKRTFEPNQLLWASTGCSGCSASPAVGSASWTALLLLLPMVRRRRR